MFFHGSCHFFDLKTNNILLPRNKYTNSKEVSEIESFFEKYKPSHINISRLNAVYLCDNIEDIDNAGGYTDYIYSVTFDYFEKSDLAWYTQAQIELEEGNIQEAKTCVLNYWNSVPFKIPEQSVWEYRTDKALILEKILY